MKKYKKEIIILVLQLIVFYILPLIATPSDTFGLIVLDIILTYAISIVVGLTIKSNYKYLYPIVITILYIPSVFIYFNQLFLKHILWYLADSYLGLVVSSNIMWMMKEKKK